MTEEPRVAKSAGNGNVFDREPGWYVGNPLGGGFELMAGRLGVVHDGTFDNETLFLDGVSWKPLWAPGVISVVFEVSSLLHSKLLRNSDSLIQRLQKS